MSKAELQGNAMMAHLLGALERGEDIGEYGRRIVATVGRFFLDEEELVGLLARGSSETAARTLVREVRERREYPPRRAKILEYMKSQRFPIIPDIHDPALDDLYRGLNFPAEVRAHIPHFEPGNPNARSQ